jgi:hypothetical protein
LVWLWFRLREAAFEEGDFAASQVELLIGEAGFGEGGLEFEGEVGEEDKVLGVAIDDGVGEEVGDASETECLE